MVNQVPVASGICGSDGNKHRCVDLAEWTEKNGRLTLVELKWHDNKRLSGETPADAVRQILRYGAVYLFCRMHKDKLPLNRRPVMAARNIKLQVVATNSFYDKCEPEGYQKFKETLNNAQMSLKSIHEEFEGLDSITLSVFAFPRDFNLPFKSDQEFRDFFKRPNFKEAGQKIIDAFINKRSLASSVGEVANK